MLFVITAQPADEARGILAEPERSYPVPDLQAISLMDILAIKQQTGLGMDFVQSAADQLRATTNTDDLDEGTLLALAIMIWLGRRKAGERHLSIEQANDFALARLDFRPEPGDQLGEETAPNPPARRARASTATKTATTMPASRGRTRTSKKLSTRA